MMNKIFALILFFIPHPFNKMIRRSLGQQVSSKSKISIFSFVLSDQFFIDDYSFIGPFTVIKAKKITIKKHAHIASMAIINAPLIEGANFELGDHSRIFPFCWLEPGEGIIIGNHVGVGGHTLIFTHGSWSDYLHGGPVSFGPVRIDDHVWLPWRVFIMPNVHIGERAIIGANSTVTKNIPANTLVTGSPAKVVKEGINLPISKDEAEKRLHHIFEEYNKYFHRIYKTEPRLSLNNVQVIFENFLIKNSGQLKIEINVKDYTWKESEYDHEHEFFISFLRRYGIRLSRSLQ